MTWKLKCSLNLILTARYPATSVVDVDAIKQKLVSGEAGQLESGRAGRMDAEKTRIKEDYTLIKILAAILSALLVIVTVFVVCCCCPSMSPVLATCHVSVPRVAECPCYRDTSRNKVGPATEEDIQVLTVRDGEGKQLQDARFVEILKSAKSRIRSATDSLRQVGTVDRCPVILHCPCRAEGAGSAGGRRGPGTGGGGGGCPCPAWTTST